MPKRLSSPQPKKKTRRPSGNMLILSLALLSGVLLTLLTFGLFYTQMLGRTPEQKTAIEAAALAAARAITKIVIDTDEVGFISLSDYAPTGRNTEADDGYSLPVVGINTLLATVRLDMIIADKLDDSLFRKMAKRDYQNALRAKDKLVAALNQAMDSGPTFKDIDGNMVDVYEEAVAAYKSNQVRLHRGTSVAPLTLRLDIGCAANASSNTPIPSPSGDAQVDDTKQIFGCYKAYVDVPYDNNSFVFAATSTAVTLIDPKNYSASASTPYFIPSVVRCQADHEYSIKDNTGAVKKVRIHDVACAQAANNLDPRPSAGALTFSFPDGMVAGLDRPLALFVQSGLQNAPVDTLQTPLTTDYPDGQMSDTVIDVLPDKHPKAVEVARVALYDWIRRGGTNPNIRVLLDMLKKPFDTSNGGQGQIHIYEFEKTGKILYSVRLANPQTTTRTVSHKQWRAVSGIILHSTGNRYFDLIIKDFVHKPGRALGGKHGGEPLHGQLPTSAPVVNIPIAMFENLGMQPAFARTIIRNGQEIDEHAGDSFYYVPPSGSGKRPSYDQTSQAVDFKFRLH
ncbi:MAG: hypothetical protein K2Y39_08475 [Candidatus Obscuribacterales bacterium]|nr:hypothetical protein [Candidatus Obscuribacterales bacterium]